MTGGLTFGFQINYSILEVKNYFGKYLWAINCKNMLGNISNSKCNYYETSCKYILSNLYCSNLHERKTFQDKLSFFPFFFVFIDWKEVRIIMSTSHLIDKLRSCPAVAARYHFSCIGSDLWIWNLLMFYDITSDWAIRYRFPLTPSYFSLSQHCCFCWQIASNSTTWRK